MRRISAIILPFLFSIGLFAQTSVEADDLFLQRRYEEASVAYGSLLRKAPNNALYLYRYARCAYEMGQDETSIAYFIRAGKKYILRDFYLGELYLRTYRFEAAREAYMQYISAIDSTHERYAYVQRQLQQAEKGARYIRRVADVAFVDSVIVPKATFLQAYRLSAECGTLQDTLGCISYTNQRNDRKIAAQRIAGLWGLLSCQRLLDGWSACDTLRLLNGVNMNYPYVLSDGITMYFASDTEAGLGGYDIYMTRYSAEQEAYLPPENIGFPFNSPANDYMLAIDEARGIGYFATDRFTADSLVAVYRFIPNAETRVLRSADSTYVREVAMLRQYRTATIEAAGVTTETNTQPNTPTAAHTTAKGQIVAQEADIVTSAATVEAEADFFFIVNDSVVCRALSDFKSLDARSMMGELLRLEQTQRETQAALETARAAYIEADDTARKALQRAILDYEAALPRLQKEWESLANQIRQQEWRERGQNER